MTNEDEVVDPTQDPTAPGNVTVSLELILASILKTIGTINVPLENILGAYNNKQIAINQNAETRELTISLIDAPQTIEVVDQQ